MKTGFWHFLAHLFRLNPAYITYGKFNGHGWMFLSCATCEAKTPYVHSAFCDRCRANPLESSPLGDRP